MAVSALAKLLLVIQIGLFMISLSDGGVGAEVVVLVDETSLQMITESLEWASTERMYDDNDEFGDEGDENDGGFGIGRRSLLWRRFGRYYISYGALAANRIPCPPRSGRSYYTHNCHKASGPVNPYTRGCSRITHCRI